MSRHSQPEWPLPNSRIFDPSQYFLGPPERIKTLEQPSDIKHHILSYDVGNGVTHLAFNNLKAKKRADRTLRVDRETVVVAVDGIAREEEDGEERAGYGVYFGKDSDINLGAAVSEEHPQTKEAALLLGAVEALQSSLEHFSPVPEFIRKRDGQVEMKKVVIVTDSPYLVKCMADWVWVWQSNGYQNSKGEWVSNHLEIAGLANVCLDIERNGIEVRFWLVEKGGVGDARRLAEKVLDDGKERNG
ncbi:uncharacterized protein PAC_03633 [Phialocephala subalpina]|uniref:ribonuclease H n=1 Tax=Phialocephala subalpina TaxID=576137 RepID=A0A1L7WLW4_9HELO|nr:uncharacterized protein PAC_03633 [Phialocephala subalpina]